MHINYFLPNGETRKYNDIRKDYRHALNQKPKIFHYAKKNRKHKQPSENLFNGWLCNWSLKHYNQYVIGNYIADVALRFYPVVIELDGSQHESNKEYDRKRDEFIKAQGFSVLRIKNYELKDKEAIKQKVFDFIESVTFKPHEHLRSILNEEIIPRQPRVNTTHETSGAGFIR